MKMLVLVCCGLGLLAGCGTTKESEDTIIVKIYPPERTLAFRETNTSLPKPTVGHPVIDTVFNTKISRVDSPEDDRTSYPKVQSWNADMSLIRITYRLYDAHTLKEKSYTKGQNGDESYATLCSPNSGYFRWSNVDASVFYTIQSNGKLIKGKVLKDRISCDEVMEDFSDFEMISLGAGEGNIDYNDRYVLLMAKKENDTALYLILYNLQTSKREWTKNLEGRTWEYIVNEKDASKNYWRSKEVDWISVSASGKYIVLNEANKHNYHDELSVYDINLSNQHLLQYRYHDKLYSEGGHGDIGYDMKGNEVYVEFLGGVPMHVFELAHPEKLGYAVLKSPYGGGHVSCRNTKRPGWCTITTQQEGYNEIYSLKLDGTDSEIVEQFSQSHNKAYVDAKTNKTYPYPATFASPSPDGTKVIFTSRWQGEPESPKEVFIAEGL